MDLPRDQHEIPDPGVDDPMVPPDNRKFSISDSSLNQM